MSVNKVILVGNLGKDPEVRYLDNNRVVANFTIATNERYTDRNGNKNEITEWHDIELWDGLAKIAEKYLKKGRQVYLEGKIRTDKWTDKDGNDRTTKKIRALNMTLLGSGSAPMESGTATSNQSESNFAGNPDAGEDDLPF